MRIYYVKYIQGKMYVISDTILFDLSSSDETSRGKDWTEGSFICCNGGRALILILQVTPYKNVVAAQRCQVICLSIEMILLLQIFQVAPSLCMVELRKSGGDTLEFHKV